jgi:hypothetical protein
MRNKTGQPMPIPHLGVTQADFLSGHLFAGCIYEVARILNVKIAEFWRKICAQFSTFFSF